MIIFIRVVQSHKLMKAVKWRARFFFPLSGELKLQINSSKGSTDQFVLVFTKSNLPLILDFISVFQTQMSQPGFAVFYSLSCWKKTSLVTNQSPFPKSQCGQKEREKKWRQPRDFTVLQLRRHQSCFVSSTALPYLGRCHCWSAWPSSAPALHGFQLLLPSPTYLILTPCHRVIIVLAWPQHLSYINNFHLFALQGTTELKMYLDWRDSSSTSLPHDLDKWPFLGL